MDPAAIENRDSDISKHTVRRCQKIKADANLEIYGWSLFSAGEAWQVWR